jgi:5-methyltetrahydrofolate--homocysteine methyltransferase
VIDLAELKQKVIDGEQEAAMELTERAIAAGCAPDSVFKEALFPAMEEVGRRMQAQVFFIPEVLMSARTMQACAGVLRPLIVTNPVMRPVGKAVACTVSGDLHDIGKNLVCLMLEGAGFQIIDLGNNCAPDKVVAAVREHRPDVVALSAMLTTTMLNMRHVVDALKAAGLRDRVHVMVGGAPVDAKFAKEIDADFYAEDAPGGSAYALRQVGAVRGDA